MFFFNGGHKTEDFFTTMEGTNATLNVGKIL
jgi:hypothetical protein